MTRERIIYINVAGFTIKVVLKAYDDLFKATEDFYKNIHLNLKGFLAHTAKRYDFTIVVIYKNTFDVLIDKKTKKHLVGFYEEESRNSFITYYHISFEQFLVIIRNTVQILLGKFGGVIMHGSAAAIEDKGVIFLGDSGAGKSTILNLVESRFQPIADDIFVLKRENGFYYIFQTPFIQKNYYPKFKTGRFLLKTIYVLKKGSNQKAERYLQQDEIFTLLSRQLFTDIENKGRQVKFLLILSVTFRNVYELSFSKENSKELIKILDD